MISSAITYGAQSGVIGCWARECGTGSMHQSIQILAQSTDTQRSIRWGKG